MSDNFNDEITVFATGVVVDEPRIFEISENRRKVTFRLESTRRFNTRSGDAHSRTTKANITSWGNNADFVAQNIRAGDRVYIRGTFETDEYTNAEGQPKRRDHVVVRSIDVLGNSSTDLDSDSVDVDAATAEF